MLLNYDVDKPIYVIGNGIPARELARWIQRECNVIIIDSDQPLKNGMQCVLGFQTLEYRKNYLDRNLTLDIVWPTYIHPMAYVADTNLLGPGVIVHPYGCVGDEVSIKGLTVVGVQVSVGHGSTVGMNNVFSPGSVLGGGTITGDNIFFGQQSSIRNHLSICSNVFICMNSVITKDIQEPGTYYNNRKQSSAVK